MITRRSMLTGMSIAPVSSFTRDSIIERPKDIVDKVYDRMIINRKKEKPTYIILKENQYSGKEKSVFLLARYSKRKNNRYVEFGGFFYFKKAEQIAQQISMRFNVPIQRNF